MRQIIVSIVTAGILLKILFDTNDFLTVIVVLPFLIFAVGLGLKNALVIMKKEKLAEKISKMYVIAFLVYWFGFLIAWDYISFIEGKYRHILFSIPFWLGGFFFTYKRLLKKKL